MTEPSRPTFEQLLSDPHLSFDLDSEVLPHLLASGPVNGCPTCRPGIYCQTHTSSGTATCDHGASHGTNEQRTCLLVGCGATFIPRLDEHVHWPTDTTACTCGFSKEDL